MPSDLALQRMTELFTPGTVAQKLGQIEQLMVSGDSRLFEGAVAWKVLVTDADQILKGDADSLDDALGMMRSTLKLVEMNQSPSTRVTLAVAEKNA